MEFLKERLAVSLKIAMAMMLMFFLFGCSDDEKEDKKTGEIVSILFWNNTTDLGAPAAPATIRAEVGSRIILPVSGSRGPATPGANATRAQIEAFENFGWRFDGWFNQAGNRVGGANDTLVITAADTLSPRWLPINADRRATITFNANTPAGTFQGRAPAQMTVISRAGAPAVPAAQMINASVLAVSSGTRFNRTQQGFSITEWSLTPTIAPNAERGVDFWNIRDTIPVEGDMTLYAIWTDWRQSTGNILISWYVGGPIVNGVNALQSPIAIPGNPFTATIDEAYILVRYPYMESGHWAGVNVETGRTLRHASGSIELWPNLDVNSRDITHPVAGAFAVNLRTDDFQYLGTADRTTNAIVAAERLKLGTNAAGNPLTDAERTQLQLVAAERLEGGEHGSPWMRVFWPGAYEHPRGVPSTPNDSVAGYSRSQNANNWWNRVVIDMSQDGSLDNTAPAIDRLRNAGHDGLGAGYLLSGRLTVGTDNFSFEVLGRWWGTVNRPTGPNETNESHTGYFDSQQHARPVWSQYWVAAGETLHFRRRAQVHRWLNEVLAFYRIHYDFAYLAQRSYDLGLTDVVGRIIFSRELVIAHVGSGTADNPEFPAYVPTRGTLPARRTLWDEIHGSIIMNAANWDFDATTIAPAAN